LRTDKFIKTNGEFKIEFQLGKILMLGLGEFDI